MKRRFLQFKAFRFFSPVVTAALVCLLSAIVLQLLIANLADPGLYRAAQAVYGLGIVVVTIGLFSWLTWHGMADLRRSEARYRELVEQAGDGMLVFDRRGTVREVNQAACYMLGYTYAELAGQPLKTLLDDGGAEEALKQAEGVVEQNFRCKDGRWLPVEINVKALDADRLQGVVRDISKRKEIEQALQASEAQLRAMFGAITDLILVINAEGRYVQIAPTNLALLYRPAAELLGRTFYDFFPRQQADEFLEAVRRALTSRDLITLEYEMDIAGRPIQFEAKLSPLSADTVVWIAHDTTTQKRRERELATVNTIGRTLAESLDLSQICEHLAAAIAQIFPDFLSLLISLYDARRQRMTLIYGVDDSGRLDPAQFPPLPLEPPGHGPQSEAIHTRQAVIVNNYPERLRRTQHKVTIGEVPQSVLYAPMLAKGEVIGVVQVQNNTRDRFGPEDAALMSFVANTAAVSITNARLFEAEREQHAVTEALHETLMALSSTLNFDEVLDLILRNSGRIVPNEAAGVIMLDQGVGRIVRWQGRTEPGQEHAVYGLELPLDRAPNLRRMAQTGRALLIPDVTSDPDWMKFPATSWVRAYCGAPIRSQGRVIGVLEVFSAAPHSYTSDHIERFQALADQVGLAIHNVQLFEAERKQHALTEVLYDTMTVLNSTLNLDEVLDRILKNVGRIVPNDAANIAVVEDGIVRSARWLGLIDLEAQQQVQDLRWKLEEVPNLRRLIESHQPQLIADTRREPGWVAAPPTHWIRSYAAAPIETKGRVLGVLELSSSMPNFFTLTHVASLHVFATQAAVAIENARLFDQTQRRLRELATLYESSVAISSSLDRSTVLNIILERLAEAVNATSTYVVWLDWEYLRGTVIAEHLTARASELERISDLGESFQLADAPRLLQAIQLGQPFYETVSQVDADPFSMTELKRYGGKSNLRIPVSFSGQVRGYFVIWDTQSERSWSDVDIRLCSTLANQAGVAILNAQLFEDAQRRAVEQAALFAAARAISSSLDFNVVLQRLAEQMTRAIDATSTYIADWNPRTRTTTVLAEYLGAEANPEERKSDLGQTYAIDDVLGEPYDWLIQGGATVAHIDDETIASAVREHLRRYGGKSMLMVALAARGTVFGYAELWDSRRKREFTMADISLCQSMAQQAAIGFENARLFEAERDQRTLAEALYDTVVTLSRTLELDEVLQRILSNAGRIVPNDLAAIQQLDGDTSRIIRIFGRLTPAADAALRGARFSISRTPSLKHMIETHRPLVVSDVHYDPGWLVIPELDWIQSFVAAPIESRGRVISILLLYSATRGFFTALHAERLQIFAAQAAIAIENAHLFEAERQQLQLAQTLQAVGALLTAEMSLADVFERLFDLLAKVVRYDSVSIQLVEDQQSRLVAGRGFPDIEQARRDVASVIKPTLDERWGTQQQRLMVIPDTHQDPRWSITPDSLYIRSWIGAALRVKGQLLGILNVNSRNVSEYDEAIGETVAAFANQAAIAIENAQLHDAERRHADELELRVQQRTKELERERRRTEAILHAAGEGIMMTDLEGRIEYMNPAMERLTGYPLDEALGKRSSIWRSQRTPMALYQNMWNTIKRGVVWRGELVNRRRDGNLYDAALSIAPLLDLDGQVTGYVGIQRDVTQQKELERLKDEFVSNVSHELRTPIANVKLYINLLTRGKPEKYEEYLQTLRREAARLEKLIEDLLDLSRLDLGTAQLTLLPTNLNQLAAQLIADRTALAAQRQLVVDYRADNDVPYVQADEAKLVQVMSNLLTNAINYTPPGGQITVVTAAHEDETGQWGTVTVQDTGPGISFQDMPHLFERFYRGEAGRKSGAPGTGLGLAISRQMMSRMGGRITVESEPGHGAAFTLWCKSIA